MRRICVSALLASALSGSAFAQVAFAQVPYVPYVASQPVYVARPPATAAAPVGQPYGGQQYGGQQYYVPQPRYAAAAPPSYAVAAPPPAPSGPGGGGFLEAIFGGPTIMAHVYQPAPPAYQPAPASVPLPLPLPLPVPLPQTAVISPPPAYAPSSHGDMSAYPIDRKYDRQVVDYRGEEMAGTIVIDTPNKFLYLVEDGGKALRYGIGVGRPGFTWAGVKTITAMREWPDWRPPADMLARRPDLPRYMVGGLDNPLGARAMYLGSTLYRIHGSNEPWTIGTNVSSGCIRMRNDDVTDLYGRVKIGTKVVVI
jgi:lipoprotein-anchoring transpeptidase ErfK/SrfK